MNNSHDQKVIAGQGSSARVFTTSYITQILSDSGASVTVYGVSGTEGQELAGTDPSDLQLPRGATGSSREQSTPQSTAPVACLIDTKSLLQVTPYRGDKASFLGWKWSFLVAVRAISKPLYGGLKKIQHSVNQDFRKSRLSNEDLELSDQVCTLLALLCKDEACAYVRATEDGNGYQAWQASLESTNSSECDKLRESVTGTNIHVTRSTNQYSTTE